MYVVVNGSEDDVGLQRAAARLYSEYCGTKLVALRYYKASRWNLFSIFRNKTGISGQKVRSWLPSIITSLMDLGTTSGMVAHEKKDIDRTFTVPYLGE